MNWWISIGAKFNFIKNKKTVAINPTVSSENEFEHRMLCVGSNKQQLKFKEKETRHTPSRSVAFLLIGASS